MTETGIAFETLVGPCRSDLDRPRLTFLHESGAEEVITGREIIDRSEALGRRLVGGTHPGDRVLLAFPAGIDFVVSFLGAVWAGLIPVPVPYPKPRRPLSRYHSIATDSSAILGLTNRETLERVDADSVSSVRWLSPSVLAELDAGATPSRSTGDRSQRPDPDTLFLQYTSGSTGIPKGVCVTLSNLMANLEVIQRGFGLDQLARDRRVVCSWLPAYHDMGLVGILLSTLVHDGHAVFMSPTSFMQRPSRWLSAVSDYQAAITVAPCFGYRYAVAKITDEEMSGMDLSGLRVAACGAEPIDPSVLRAFSERFASVGFSDNAFYPCYGLAECTLMVTGADRLPGSEGGRAVRDGTFDAPGYHCQRISRQGMRDSIARPPEDASDAVELVSSGVSGNATLVRVVDPLSSLPLGENHIGEIWVHSDSVAAGYWDKPETSQSVFGSRLSGDERRYLRTGDLGYLSDGQLYVTGRLKDLIIIRGQNHYPEDLERTVQASIGGRADCLGAVFSVSDETGESLAIVQEVPRGFTAEQSGELLDAIRMAIASEHDLIASAILLIRFASMPRTSSGKVQRGQCRQQFLDDTFKVIDRWQPTIHLDPALFPDKEELLRSVDVSSPHGQQIVRDRIERVLLNWLVGQLGCERNSVDAQRPFAECGIDSLMAVEMSGQMEHWLDVRLSPVIAWSHPNAEKLAEYLADQLLGNQQHTDVVAEQSIETLLAEIESMNEMEVLDEIGKD
ncbi:AMP-binding protein [Allorhodopirellula solitaria]|uniref:Long-chain-fatty-acid--AMP ligase FadD29 n=1 Tax=Allorhodopirellula solitaria TaxID=2527987 RepID=A0A5C5XRU3_9BACT|nr:AMP-binding protein [Allorhodopirellula solitaria]TWT65369.1 Long-chain-fatty-acid--AMP ligase FadD29 [Allorhodopirellula solitaria]